MAHEEYEDKGKSRTNHADIALDIIDLANNAIENGLKTKEIDEIITTADSIRSFKGNPNIKEKAMKIDELSDDLLHHKIPMGKEHEGIKKIIAQIHTLSHKIVIDFEKY